MPGVFIAIGSRNEARGLHYATTTRASTSTNRAALGVEVLLETTRRYLAS